MYIEDDKLSTADSSDTEGKSGFGTKARNESDSDNEEGEDEDAKEDDENESDLEVEESRTKKTFSPEVPEKEMKQNEEGEERTSFGWCTSRSSLRRQRKSTQEFGEKTSKAYDVRAL